MGAAEHPGFLDPRELVDAVLDLLREELEPRHEDDGLLPALEGEGARPVEPANVARHEPAIPRDPFSQLPRPVVRGEQTVAPHGYLAQPARRPTPALVGADGDLLAGNGPPPGA